MYFSCRQCYRWWTRSCSNVIIPSICFYSGDISVHEFIMMSRCYLILIFFFFFFLVVGRESWAWEQTICNIFLDLLRTCFAWVLQSFQIAKVASRREFAWVYNDFPTRFVHFYVISHTRLGTLWEKLITKMSWMTVLKFALQKLSQLEYLNHVIWSISITIFKQWNKNEF